MSLEAEEVHRTAILTALHARRQLKRSEFVPTTQGQNPGVIVGKAKAEPCGSTLPCQRAPALGVPRNRDRWASTCLYIVMQFEMQIKIKRTFPNKKDAIKF